MRSLCVWVLLLGMVGCDDVDSSFADAAVDAPTTDAGVDALDGALEDSAVEDTAPADTGEADSGVPTEIVFTEPPIDPGVPVRFSTVAYGSDSKQVMDIWLPEAEAPTAVVIFYHGGGFVGGSRESAHGGAASMLRMVLEAGIAWVGIDYRFITDTSIGGVRGSLDDARYGLQFVRHHAETLNIDVDRVGLTGGSAGAGTSLWLALHDDMADPENEDPIRQMSTRVSAVTVWETQATYDLMKWPTDVYSPTYPMTPEELLAQRANALQVTIFYGLPIALHTDPEALLEQLTDEEYTAYRADIDMLAMMSPDDPPLYVFNNGPDAAPGASGFDLLHHPLHAMAVRERAMEEGVMIEANVPSFDVEAMVGTVEHLQNNLGE